MSSTRPAHGPRIAVERLEDRLNPGGGTFDSATGTFNFSVAVLFDATAAELTAIQKAFQGASDIIRDATDDQHRFGNVTIVNASSGSAEAEFWIWKVNDSSLGWPDAQPAGYGKRGLHSNLYQYINDKTYGSQLYGGNGDGAAYTIAHEFGHQAYGILDEYSGPLDPEGDDKPPLVENAPPSTTEGASLTYSLMDNYFTRGGRFNNPGGKYTLNEFSVASNHDPDNDTNQTVRNRRDDWAQVAARYPVTIPTGLPKENFESTVPTSRPVNFILNATNAPYTVIAFDNSLASVSPGLLEGIKAGTKVYLQSASPHESVGVVLTEGFTASQLRTMTDANRQAALDAVDAIRGTPTPEQRLRDAVQIAIDQITGRVTRSANQVVVLVGTGVRNQVGNVLDLIPKLNQENISVLSILINPNPTGADLDTFRILAESTGGKFVRLERGNAGEVAALYSMMLSERQGSGLLSSAPPSDLPANATVTDVVTVAPGTPEVILGATALVPGAGVTVTLVSPSGQTISAAGPGVEALAGGPLVGFRVTNPEAGTWQVQVTAGAADAGPVAVVGLLPNDPYRVVVSADAGQVAYPSPITVRVTPMHTGRNVVGASVTGLAVSPTGDQVPVFFFDDGLPAHGDVAAGDGIYSTRFSAYSHGGTGAYSFQVVVNGVGATMFAGEAIPGSGTEAPQPQPVPDFIRTGTGTVVVTGVPATVVSNDLTVLITPVGPMSFAVTVQNNGPTDATGVRTGVFLGSGLKFLGGVATQGAFAAAGGTVTFDAGSLAPGATATLTLNVLPRRSGTVNVIADVASADHVDPLLENNEFGLPVPLTKPERVAVGADRGAGALVLIDPTTGQQTTLTPFGAGFVGGVRVATGDLTGDGLPDVVAGAGPGGAPEVAIFDGATGAEVRRIPAFEASFQGGVYVAVGDFNGDGFSDVIITPDEGGGPRVRIFDGKTGDQLADFFGIEDPNFRGGARAAAGDVNGDGTPDLLVGAGFGGGPRLAVFDGRGLRPDGAPKLFGDFLVFEETLRNGVFVTAGDVTGDGFADVIVGGGPGGGPRVFGLSGRDLVEGQGKTFTQVANFFAGDPNNRQGVRVSVKDLDGDDLADLVTGSGATGVATSFAGQSIPVDGTPPTLAELSPFGPLPFGVFVG